MRRATVVMVCAAGLLAAACGGAASSSSHAPRRDAADVRVCEHYRAQRAFVKNDTAPTLADAVKVLGWIAGDVGQVTPGTPLARDLARMLAVMRGHGSPRSASLRVLKDCQALGVTF